MRIRKAEQFLAQAQRALATPASPDTAAALAVLAAIAASDAACCAQLGVRSRGQHHRQARQLLAQVRPDGAQMARLLDDLLSSKDSSHYGTTMMELGRARRLVLSAEQLVRSANRAVRRPEGNEGF